MNPTLRDIILLCLIGLLAYLPGLASLPVIDRDEARYAQATVQMVETGDYIDIRFQNEPRYKKPVGAYWAQVAGLAVTGQLDNIRAGERPIWAQRLPSVLGALIAVIATYLAGLKLFDRRTAFLGATLLAVSVSLIFEAHMAKTDAMLAGASAVVLYGWVARKPWPFWLGMAAGILLKGPVIVGVVLLAVSSFKGLTMIRSRKSQSDHPGSPKSEVKSLTGFSLGSPGTSRRTMGMGTIHSPLPILTALALTLPWFIAIYFVSDGAFYADALGKDFGAKIGGAQETHGGPPGYYALTTLVMFWPGIIALPLAAVWAWRNRTLPAVTLLLCWLVPMWLVLELVPTKLPHYTLPLYPALALLCGAAITSFTDAKVTRWVGAVLFAITGGALAFAIGFIGPGQVSTFALGPLAAALIVAAIWIWIRQKDIGLSLIAGIICAGLFLGWSAPYGGYLNLSENIADKVGKRPVYVANYNEPSLIYLIGPDRVRRIDEAFSVGMVILAGEGLIDIPACAESEETLIVGEHYAKGRLFLSGVSKTDDCEAEELETWRATQNDKRADSEP